MFDQKTVDAYKKIRPSDGLRDKVLSQKPRNGKAVILELKRYASLAACIALIVVIGIAAGRGFSDGGITVALADGSPVGEEAVTVYPVTANYTAAARIALHTGNDTVVYPAPVSANDCFYLEISSKDTAVIRTSSGSVFMYDEEAGNYLEYTYDAYFEGTANIYWHLNDSVSPERHTLTVTSKDKTVHLTLTKAEDGYTLTSVTEEN